MTSLRFAAAILLCVGLTAFGASADDAKERPIFKDLTFRSIGPYAGGRVCRSCGIPGDPLVYYSATAAGGVWKSTDGGMSWKPIFEQQLDSSIGSIAVAPSDPNVIYIGAGEANIRGNVVVGHGIYKSTDGGKTWQHVWNQQGQIGQMIVHPQNPSVALAAVLGHAFGPNPERGVYRTRDGGKTWQQVLKKDSDTGAIEVCFDPNNPHVIFAALWQTRRRPWEMTSGGPGSGLYVSRDDGDTWTQLTENGLPDGIWGRIGLAIAPSDSRRIYALIEAEKGGLYRSDDSGEKWDLVNANHYIRQRPWYFSAITVDPQNADTVYSTSVRLLKSTDGGRSFKQLKGPHHGDHHDLWIDPRNPRRMIDSNDGGVDITVNGGETWMAPPLPIAQFYHVHCDNKVPYHVSGTMQDIGTAGGPSNSLVGPGILAGDWYGVGGGETGFTTADPTDPNIIYAGEYGGYLSIYDHRTRQARNISKYPFNPSGHGAEDLRYRFQWTAPVLISPHDNKTLYHAANVLLRTTDRGQTWKAISPDLTRNDVSKQKWSGGPITGDNTGVEVFGTIFALAESIKQKGLLWAGSDDGLVHVSRDGGANWLNVTKNIPGVPEWSTVRCLETSPVEPGKAYAVFDNHRQDDMKPYVFKTTDYGATWKSLTAGLAQDAIALVVREDLKVPGMLYLGTDRGVMMSANDGASWVSIKLNLPTVQVTDLIVKGDDLVVGTNGRSIWVFDDLTPFRALRDSLAKPDKEWPATWFAQRAGAVRWRYANAVYAPDEKAAGDNPAKGVVAYYFLREKAKSMVLDVLDGTGEVIRSFSDKEEKEEEEEDEPDAAERDKPTVLSLKPGIHRAVWDLRHMGARVIAGAKVDAGSPKAGPLAAPGQYKLRWTVDGKVVQMSTIEVTADPRLKLTASDYAEQLQTQLRLRDDISKLSGIVESLRSVKKQIQSREELLKEVEKAKKLIDDSNVLVAKLDALEAKLHNPKASVVYDILAQKGGAQLYSQLSAIYDWIGDSDGPITEGMREMVVEHIKTLERLSGQWRELVMGELASLNRQATALELPTIFVAPEKDAKK
jgi:photosystem II stability/assembly factor-like uncharacterized protein